MRDLFEKEPDEKVTDDSKKADKATKRRRMQHGKATAVRIFKVMLSMMLNMFKIILNMMLSNVEHAKHDLCHGAEPVEESQQNPCSQHKRNLISMDQGGCWVIGQ